MIERKALNPQRIRKIIATFAFVPHRFLRQGFWAGLSHHELLLYFFLVLVADRQGLSYYSFDKICSMVAITPDEYVHARNCLINKDLIAFDGHLFQVLSLPERMTIEQAMPLSVEEMASKDPATISQLIQGSLGNAGE